MPKTPHWYTRRSDWGDDKLFNEVVASIRRMGEARMFKGSEYTYFDANGYTYWTMGWPVKETTIINRAKS